MALKSQTCAETTTVVESERSVTLPKYAQNAANMFDRIANALDIR